MFVYELSDCGFESSCSDLNVEGVAENWVEVSGSEWRWVHGLVIPVISNITRSKN